MHQKIHDGCQVPSHSLGLASRGSRGWHTIYASINSWLARCRPQAEALDSRYLTIAYYYIFKNLFPNRFSYTSNFVFLSAPVHSSHDLIKVTYEGQGQLFEGCTPGHCPSWVRLNQYFSHGSSAWKLLSIYLIWPSLELVHMGLIDWSVGIQLKTLTSVE